MPPKAAKTEKAFYLFTPTWSLKLSREEKNVSTYCDLALNLPYRSLLIQLQPRGRIYLIYLRSTATGI